MRNQLILTTDKECNLSFKLVNPSSRHNEADYSGIPLVMHTNYSICWEATDYILHLYTQNKNTANSTLLTYARHLSRVVAFIDYYRISFSDLNDYILFDLVKFLQSPKHSKNNRPCDNNQVNKIINKLFNLLNFLQEQGRIPADTISMNSAQRAQINVKTSEYTPKGTNVKRERLSHTAHLSYKNTNKRSAITDDSINILIKEIYKFTDNEFIQDRWCNLLSVMEWTGARESEIAILTTKSVYDAISNMKEGNVPKVQFTTTKGKNNGKSRLVPIPNSTAQELYNHIIYERNPIVNQAISDGKLTEDHGFVFVTDEGDPISGKRIYDHFREVRLASPLKTSQASPHMFRHRYITIQVRERLKELISKQNNYKTGIESFVVKRVKLLTGHASDASIYDYVDDIMYELHTFEKAEKKLLKESEIKAKERQINALISEGIATKSSRKKSAVFDKLIQLLGEDSPYLEMTIVNPPQTSD